MALKSLMVALAFGCSGLLEIQATEFPFEVRTLSVEQATFLFPGVARTGALRAAKPASLKREPKAVSNRPLYAELPASSPSVNRVLLRLDEAAGRGRGYSSLILDVNGNGDLTDDPVIMKIKAQPYAAADNSTVVFGPVRLPLELLPKDLNLGYYVIFSSYDIESYPAVHGLVSLRPASRLVAEMTVDGTRQWISVVDANANGCLDELVTWNPMHAPRSSVSDKRVLLGPSDFFLREFEYSAQRKSRLLQSDTEPFSRWFYVGNRPQIVSFSEDFRGFRLQPFNGPVGEVTIPEQVNDLALIRLTGSNDLVEAVTPVFREGKAWVPTGHYRVMSFVMGAAASDDSVVRASESIPLTQAEFAVEANQTIALTLGLPWELTIVVKPPAMRAANSSSSIMDAARSLFTASTSLRFNVQVQGPAGERFPGFYRIGGSSTLRIPPPTFSIAGPDGKVLDSGSFEYG